ncbi:MAG TPA: fused MFS/spermidine synthase, partial [Thermomicrobiaceae bacterium]|nr:fused MFS/spermidine synthase [Thermomicrobiaceae bacterium]
MTSTSAALDRPPADIVRNPRLFNAMLLVIVFVGGVCSVAIELSAARLLGPFFGTSDIIWANLIGLTLLYLSVGYFVGGKIADRWPSATLLYVFTALAGFATGLIPLIAHPILEGSLIAFEHLAVGAFYGSLVGVLLLFAIPVTMLGFVSPFAIRLRVSSVSSAGNTAGSLYALSTVGSILGSFLPVLILIPTIGTYQTFYALSITLLVASALALFALHARVHAVGAVALALIVLLAARFWTSTIVRPPQIGTLIYQTESQYNYIQVVKQGNTTMLMLDDGHAVHSIYNPMTEITGGPWDYFMVAPFFNPNETPRDVHNVALIGLA